MGGTPASAQDLWRFVSRNFSDRMDGPLGSRIGAEADALLGTPLNDLGKVTEKLRAIHGVGADDAAATARRIVDMANDRGGDDNVTCLVVYAANER